MRHNPSNPRRRYVPGLIRTPRRPQSTKEQTMLDTLTSQDQTQAEFQQAEEALEKAQRAYAAARDAIPGGPCGSEAENAKELILEELYDRVWQAQWRLLGLPAPSGTALLKKLEILTGKDLTPDDDAWKLAIEDVRRLLPA
jgi:hypothetical protein